MALSQTDRLHAPPRFDYLVRDTAADSRRIQRVPRDGDSAIWDGVPLLVSLGRAIEAATKNEYPIALDVLSRGFELARAGHAAWPNLARTGEFNIGPDGSLELILENDQLVGEVTIEPEGLEFDIFIQLAGETRGSVHSDAAAAVAELTRAGAR